MKNVTKKNGSDSESMENELGYLYKMAREGALDKRSGKWIKGKNSFYYCSSCNHEAYWDTDYGQQLFDYCPYCGARMENGNEIN